MDFGSHSVVRWLLMVKYIHFHSFPYIQRKFNLFAFYSQTMNDASTCFNMLSAFVLKNWSNEVGFQNITVKLHHCQSTTAPTTQFFCCNFTTLLQNVSQKQAQHGHLFSCIVSIVDLASIYLYFFSIQFTFPAHSLSCIVTLIPQPSSYVDSWS